VSDIATRNALFSAECTLLDPLFDAAEAGDVDALQAAVERGISVKALAPKSSVPEGVDPLKWRYSDSRTALHVAILQGQLKTAAWLVEREPSLISSVTDMVRLGPHRTVLL
jgi:hypothetical protein